MMQPLVAPKWPKLLKSLDTSFRKPLERVWLAGYGNHSPKHVLRGHKSAYYAVVLRVSTLNAGTVANN